MKIGIIGFAKLKYMPYLNFYMDGINTAANQVHILYWNRDGRQEKRRSDVEYHEFNDIMDDDSNKVLKIRKFMRYRSFALSVIKEQNFDFIIILHSIPGVLLESYMKRCYNHRYIFDYRDYTYESILPFRCRIWQCVYNSYATFISSEGFRTALPDVSQIYVSHNISTDLLKQRRHHAKNQGSPIRISFWGYIRHEQVNRTLIQKISEDQRFELHFYGREQAIAQRLKAYANQINAKNVFFHGEYNPEDRLSFAANTDLIHNIYSNKELPHQKLAVSNKYYDALALYIPQICMNNSYMGELVQKNGIGIACDPKSDNFLDTVFLYYKELDYERFCGMCDCSMERVMSEYENGKRVIENAFDQHQ